MGLENEKKELVRLNSQLSESDNKPATAMISTGSSAATTEGPQDERVQKLEQESKDLQA